MRNKPEKKQTLGKKPIPPGELRAAKVDMHFPAKFALTPVHVLIFRLTLTATVAERLIILDISKKEDIREEGGYILGTELELNIELGNGGR